VRYKLFTMVVLPLLSACEQSPTVRTESIGSYIAQISHQPEPLQVGFDAELQLKLTTEEGFEQRECRAHFRQYMPDMDMSHDNDVVAMKANSAGMYTGRTRTFSMGGLWIIELTVDCGPGPVTTTLSYNLEWPE